MQLEALLSGIPACEQHAAHSHDVADVRHSALALQAVWVGAWTVLHERLEQVSARDSNLASMWGLCASWTPSGVQLHEQQCCMLAWRRDRSSMEVRGRVITYV